MDLHRLGYGHNVRIFPENPAFLNLTPLTLTMSKSTGRWGLLREALLGRSETTATDAETNTATKDQDDHYEASMHAFRGWNLIPRRTLVDSETDENNIDKKRTAATIPWTTMDRLEDRILALQCVRHVTRKKGSVELIVVGSNGWQQSNEWNDMRERLARKGILVRVLRSETETEDDNNDTGAGTTRLRCTWSYCDYRCVEYNLSAIHDNDNRTSLTTRTNAMTTTMDTAVSSSLRIRERVPSRRKTVNELASHLWHGGIDNTGQVCVWDSASTLTYLLLQAMTEEESATSEKVECSNDDSADTERRTQTIETNPTETFVNKGNTDSPNSNDKDNENKDRDWRLCLRTTLQQQEHDKSARLGVIELGCGMAGLAGLTLASLRPNTSVLLTDGHPDAVRNNRVHAELNKWATGSFTFSHQLLWGSETTVRQTTHDDDDDNNDDKDPGVHGPFHLALASDCTHFHQHHGGLAKTLTEVLAVHGVAVLCQPPRAGTLDAFLRVCEAMNGLWTIQVIPEPSDKLRECHESSLSDPHYDPDRHRPVLCLLHKTRQHTEEDLRDAARRHQQNEADRRR